MKVVPQTHVLRSAALPLQSIGVSTVRDEKSGRVHEILMSVGGKATKGFVTYDDYLRYSATTPGHDAAVSHDGKVTAFYVSAEEDGKFTGRSPVVVHHRRPNEAKKESHYEVVAGAVGDHFVQTAEAKVVGAEIKLAKYRPRGPVRTHEQNRAIYSGDRAHLFSGLHKDGFATITDHYRKSTAPNFLAPRPTIPKAQTKTATPPLVLRPETKPAAQAPLFPRVAAAARRLAEAGPKTGTTAKKGKVTAEDARFLAEMDKLAQRALKSKAPTDKKDLTIAAGVDLTDKSGSSTSGRLQTGGGGAFVGGGGRSSTIDAGRSATAGTGAFSVATAGPTVAPKTANEFKAAGVEISPGKDLKSGDPVYKGDLRPSGDKSEPNTLTFGQFVQTTTKGGHDVKFALTISKDMIKSPASRDAVRDRMLQVVDASLEREKMDEGSRLGVGMALKGKLTDVLAKLAAE